MPIPTIVPPDVFGGTVTVHIGPEHPSHLLVPIIPKRDE